MTHESFVPAVRTNLARTRFSSTAVWFDEVDADEPLSVEFMFLVRAANVRTAANNNHRSHALPVLQRARLAFEYVARA